VTVKVTTDALKTGDVIEEAGRYGVVRKVYKNANGMPEADVLYADGGTSLFTEAPSSVSAFHLQVGDGCEPNLEAMKNFVEALNWRSTAWLL